MKPGSLLQGRYQVLGLVGEGSMGTVYRGERVGLGRPVAIKFLQPKVARDAQFARRFDREARAMSKLAHPNCISVIDYGFEEGPYLVMELVEGTPLRAALAEGPLPPRRALSIVHQLLAGLAHAHGQGIIHRDVKPENILLVQGPGLRDHVCILDFGLAKLHGNDGLLTGNGCLGTPDYMAPEQLGEGFGAVDARTDLYATGIVLYELLAGRKPFDGADLGGVLVKQLQEAPPLFATLSLAVMPSPQLEAVVRRALSKKTAGRFASAAEMLSALETVPEWTDVPVAARAQVEATVLERRPWGAGRPPALLANARARLQPLVKAAREKLAPAGRRARGWLELARLRGLVLWRTLRLWSRHRPRLAVGAVAAGIAGLTALVLFATGPRATVRAMGPAAAAVAPAPPPRTPQQRTSDDAAALARAAFEKRRPLEGMSAFRVAIRNDRDRRSDPVLIGHLIDTLRSDRFGGAAEELLTELKREAKPHLRQAAKAHASPKVRARARDLLKELDGRSTFRLSGRN